MLQYINRFWKKLRRKHSLGKLHYVESMHDIPDRLGDHVYIVGLRKPQWVIISCPCRCGERITINVMEGPRPRWQMKVHNGFISLRPSLWVSNNKCGSHFWIEKNRVIWVKEQYHH